ncbi:MAG TPA: hypothetical protein VFU21_31615 [Kofleriaceae bacterium]|nr:hypothetical protein [Kofleriaceae bacterium]
MTRVALALCAVACAGGGKKSATAPESPAPAEKRERPAPAGEVSEACRTAYAGYVAAWSDWFDTELDSDAQAAIIAEFGEELPRRAALEEMRVTADELRYEPGFELWIRALTATEEAIEHCGEGAPRPR